MAKKKSTSPKSQKDAIEAERLETKKQSDAANKTRAARLEGKPVEAKQEVAKEVAEVVADENGAP